MDKTFTKMWRWSLVSAAVVGAYWLVYYLLIGSVPSQNTIGFIFNDGVLLTLNFSVSNWFDILIGPIWLSFLIFWWDKVLDSDNWINNIGAVEWIKYFLCLVVALGFVDALLTGILTGLATTIIGCLGVILITILILIGLSIVDWANAK